MEDSTNLRPDAVPQAFLAEFVIVGNMSKPHDPTIGLRSAWSGKLVGGRPVYELGTAATETRETTIVFVGLVLGHIVGVVVGSAECLGLVRMVIH